MRWSAYEGSEKKQYTFAMPYYVMVGEYHNGQLLGARVFYSPTPITSLTDPLYYVNLPNTNCRGYGVRRLPDGVTPDGGLGVGWICLYHHSQTLNNDADRIRYLIDRCSGGEPFNDGNMGSTDGTRFYKEHRAKQPFLWKPEEWEAKSLAEGWEWTLDPSLWIPALVTGMDGGQGKHDPKGMPLTLGMVMYGYQKFYYTDILRKPYNVIAREAEPDEHTLALLGSAMSANLKQAKAPTLLTNKALGVGAPPPVARPAKAPVAAPSTPVVTVTAPAPAKKAAAKKAAAKKTPAKKAAAKKAPAKKVAARKVAAKKAPARKAATKTTSTTTAQ